MNSMVKGIKPKRSVLIFIIVSVSYIFGAFESYPVSTVNVGLGNLKLSVKGDLIDVVNEPSSLIAFGSTGGEALWSKPFQISELRHIAFAGGMLYKRWGFGINVSSFGNKIYNESTFSLSAAGSFKQNLHLGISVHVYHLNINDYGNDQTVGLTASARYHINANWDWVSSIRNINSPKISSIEEKLPQIVTTGFIGTVHRLVKVAAEWEQDIEYEGALKFGVLVQPIEQVLLAVGYVSNPGQFTAGISLTINNLYFEYGTIAYNDLGLFTHQLGIGFNINWR